MMSAPDFPRTYRMKSGPRVFLLTIALLIFGVGAAGIYLELEFSPVYYVILLPFGLVAAVGAIMAWYFLAAPEITLTRSSIELRTALTRRELFKSEIAGYRRVNRYFGNATIMLFPSDLRDRGINIRRFMRRDQLFEEWLRSLRNLDQVGVVRSSENMPGDAEDAARPGWVLAVAMVLNIAGAFWAVVAVLSSGLSDELGVVLVSAPLLALMMAIIWRVYFRLDFRGDGTRTSLFFLFFLPGISLAWRANSDIELAGWEMPVVAAAAIALLIAIISRASYRRSFEAGSRLAVLFVLMLPYGFGLTLFTNASFDTSLAQTFPVTIQHKHYSPGGRYHFARYWVDLGSWGERLTESSITVPGDLYRRLDIGMVATVRLYRGAFRMPYYTLHPSIRLPDLKWVPVISDLEAGVAAYDKGEFNKALELLRKPVEDGDDRAQFYVGILHRDGRGTSRDTDAAMRLFQLASAQGNARAMHAIGYAYDRGIGVTENLGEAIEWYRKAATANDPSALTSLGALYQEGRGVTQNFEHARRLLLQAAELAWGPAMNNLGMMYANGTGVTHDMAEATGWWVRSLGLGNKEAAWYLGRYLTRAGATTVEISEGVAMLREAALSGNAQAAFKLSILYGSDRGVPKSSADRLKWLDRAIDLDHPPAMLHRGGLYAEVGQAALAAQFYRRAAEMGYARAQAYLGKIYADGNSVARDLTEAVKWYARAIAQGDAMGQRLLAYSHHAGLGVDKNPQEAARLYRLAAIQGDAYAADNLALMLLYGLGVSRDETEGLKWTRMAADQGQPIALNNLANMLDRGDPVGRDVTAALVFYRRAAAHGQANAAHSLATHYFSGRSIERDIEESYYWTLIAERGYSASERTNIVSLKRSILAEILETGGDRAAIEKRASQFRPLPAPPAPIPSAKPYVTPQGR